ncbi:hypothetical protein [Pontibacter kalidii]|uniref:hypothetical protein n=1 Tax=Pontibacter kalidii TaxID=2592049 RepID=UPI0022521CAC|nr:hypothetical protein [Pontibacter kalidii]
MSRERKRQLGKYKPASIKVWLTRIRKSAAEVVPDKDVRNSKYKKAQADACASGSIKYGFPSQSGYKPDAMVGHKSEDLRQTKRPVARYKFILPNIATCEV